jgi:hypothetical protein
MSIIEGMGESYGARLRVEPAEILRSHHALVASLF